MLNLGFSEVLFILVIALIFIGPKQLPEVARTLGRFLNEMKRASNGLFDELKQEARRSDYENLIKPPPIPEETKPTTAENNSNTDKKENPHS